MNAQAAAAPVEREPRTAVSTHPHSVLPVAPLRRGSGVRPNDPCPCGCGRKAKKCLLVSGGDLAEAAPPDTLTPESHEAAPPQADAATDHESLPATPVVPEAEPLEAHADCAPIAAEGTGCAAWMRLTGLYPWKPLALSERRAGLDRLTRYTRQWMIRRKAGGGFRSFENEEAAGSGARTHAEPSYELAEALEISEAKLNGFCRESTGLSAREWWDVVRAPDAARAIRAEIEAALDGAELDRTSHIRRRGIQLMDVYRALRQHRRTLGNSASERAWNLGYKSAARLNLALWRATGQSMQQLEMSILREIFETWAFDHRTCRLCAKIEPRAAGDAPAAASPSIRGASPAPAHAQPDGADWNPGIRIA